MRIAITVALLVLLSGCAGQQSAPQPAQATVAPKLPAQLVNQELPKEIVPQSGGE